MSILDPYRYPVPVEQPATGWRKYLRLGDKKRQSTLVDPDNSNSRWPAIPGGPIELDPDDAHLFIIGYRQTLKRTLGSLDSFLLMFATLNFTSGLPALFFAIGIFAGGPLATLVNWVVVGLFSIFVALSLAELSASMPVAGGIYYFAFELGGEAHGRFLAWLTAWLNWGGWIIAVPALCQVSVRFLVSMILMAHPTLAIINKPWFEWILIALTLLTIVLIPNVMSTTALSWTLRAALLTHLVLLSVYFIWIPVSVGHHGHFHPDMLHTFNNWINPPNTAPVVGNSYCWVIGTLTPAWIFFGYDVCVHTAEETKDASKVSPKGMYKGTLATVLISIPVVIVFLVCIQDLQTLATYGFPQYLMQTVGHRGSMAVLFFCYIDTALATSIYFISAQRVTYAMARDGILPSSAWIEQLSKNKMPVHAAFVVVTISIIIATTSIGSTVALPAITAGATVSINLSYFVVILSRHTVGSKNFKRAQWKLGFMSFPIGVVALAYISYIFVLLVMPFTFPVTWQTLNYAPLMLIAILSLTLGSWVAPSWGGRVRFKGLAVGATMEQRNRLRIKKPKETRRKGLAKVCCVG